MTKDELNNKLFEILELDLNGKVETVLFIDERIDKDLLKSLNAWAYYIRHSDEDSAILSTIEDSVFVNFAGTIVCGERINLACYDHIDDWNFTGDTVTIPEFLAQYKPKFFEMEDDLKAQCVNYMLRAVEANGPISFSDPNQPYINQMPIACVSIDGDGFFIAENAESNKLIHESAMNVANLFDLAKAVYNQTKDNKL